MNVLMILWKSKWSLLLLLTVLIKAYFSLHFSAVSKIISLAHCLYWYMIKQPIKCALYMFLEYICCSKFFLMHLASNMKLGEMIQNISTSGSHRPPFVYPSDNILGDFLLWASLKPLIEPLVCLFKVFPLTFFSKMVFKLSLCTFLVSLGFPLTNGIMMVFLVFRDFSWTMWTCKVSVKSSLNFCSHFFLLSQISGV